MGNIGAAYHILSNNKPIVFRGEQDVIIFLIIVVVMVIFGIYICWRIK